MSAFSKYKNLCLATVLSAALAPSIVQASVVSYDFTATINRLSEWHPFGPGPIHPLAPLGPGLIDVTSSTIPGGAVLSIGDTLAGQISWDTAARAYNGPMYDSKQSYSAPENVHFTIHQSGLNFQSTPGFGQVAIGNDVPSMSGADTFTIRAWDDGWPDSYLPHPPLHQSVSLNFQDDTGMVFNNWDMPAALSLSSFSSASIGGVWEWEFYRGVYARDAGFFADITSLTPSVSPVPEPETYALMLAGLGLVGWMARRKSAIKS